MSRYSKKATRRAAGGKFWSTLLWALVFPQRSQRTVPTISGLLLIGLAFGVGTAAYNAANNILFITLSLLLACLVLSGVLSWLNFRGLDWELKLTPPFRVGQEASVGLVLRNEKKVIPGYGLWFDLVARAVDLRPPAKAETTFTARGIDLREALAGAERAEQRTRLFLRTRLDPGAETRLEWAFKPTHRGRLRMELDGIGSLFPFGFLQKSFSPKLAEEVTVWPAPVEYRRFNVATSQRAPGNERATQPGSGSDLLSLRRYEAGDSHRLIHWKASARTGQLLVRQFAAETAEAYSLWLRTDATEWTRAEQFELFISLVATLAEDLFRAGQLNSVAIDDEPPAPVRRVRDLEAWLDRLAAIEAPGELNSEFRSGRVSAGPSGRRNLITFAPDGPRGVVAWVEGQRFAAT